MTKMNLRLITITAYTLILINICSCCCDLKEIKKLKTNARELKEYINHINKERQVLDSLDLFEINNDEFAFVY